MPSKVGWGFGEQWNGYGQFPLPFLWENHDYRKYSDARWLRRILARLDTVKVIEEMDLPGYRLHPLKGELQGFYAVTVQANWRVIFRFEQGDVFDVDYVDYH